MFLIIFFLSLFFVSPLYAMDIDGFCNSNQEISVNYHIDYGNVDYKSVSDFPKQKNNIDGYNIKGLTDINYKRSYDIRVSLYSYGNKACLMITSIGVYFGFPKIDILISDKYQRGSCKYNVIKKHENQHVKNYQGVLKKYSEAIGKIIHNRVKERKPLIINNVDDLKISSEKYVFDTKDFITSDVNLNRVENEMMEEIEYQNALLDSKESYDKTKKMCSGW